jgi:predicted NAD/FAD-binding protein
MMADLVMEKADKSQVVDAHRLAGGVIITFQDGRTALYSAALLASIFDQASTIIEPEDDGDGSQTPKS